MSKNEANDFKILLKLGKIFSVTPSYEYIRSDRNASLMSRIYGILFPAGIVMAYGVCLNGTIKYRYKKFHVEAVGVIIDSMTTFLFASSAVITTLSPTLHRQTWRKFFNLLEDVNKDMNYSATDRTNNTRRARIEFFFAHVTFLLIYFWNISVWAYFLGIQTSGYYIFRHSAEYIPFLSTILMVYLNRIIRDRYTCLNKAVKQPAVWAVKRNFTSELKQLHLYVRNSTVAEESIRRIQRNFRKLGKLVCMFNNIFGYQILFLIGMTILTLLESLESALREDSILIMSWSSVTTAFSVMKFVAIVFSCDATTREAQNIIGVCYDMQEHFPELSVEREELLRLVDIALHERVHFSAADFFDLNRTTIFGVLSVTATYYIITIQFNQIL